MKEDILRNKHILFQKNEIFVLGDNRVNSQDSRYIGTIPNKNIVGKAIYVVFPFDNFKNIDD